MRSGRGTGRLRFGSGTAGPVPPGTRTVPRHRNVATLLQALKLATWRVASYFMARFFATYQDATLNVASRPAATELATSCTAHPANAPPPMHKFSRHRGLRAFRTPVQRVQGHFGFTQQEVADLLAVTRAVLSMSGQPSRTLPFEAWKRLQWLLDALPPEPVATADGPAPAPPAPPLPPPAFADDERQGLDLRRRGLELQAQALSRQLARCQTRLAQARLRQQAIPGLRALFPVAEELAHVQFNIWERRAAATLRTEGNAATLLALRQSVLAFEAAALGRLLGGDGSEE